MVHQNAPHRPGGEGEKMDAVFESRFAFVEEDQEQLVHQARGFERMIGPFAPQVAGRNVAEMRIH
jgi:hypothetical protein